MYKALNTAQRSGSLHKTPSFDSCCCVLPLAHSPSCLIDHQCQARSSGLSPPRCNILRFYIECTCERTTAISVWVAGEIIVLFCSAVLRLPHCWHYVLVNGILLWSQLGQLCFTMSSLYNTLYRSLCLTTVKERTVDDPSWSCVLDEICDCRPISCFQLRTVKLLKHNFDVHVCLWECFISWFGDIMWCTGVVSFQRLLVAFLWLSSLISRGLKRGLRATFWPSTS